MITIQNDLQALKEARRQSAAKVRSLLEQLEEAEKEFAAITVQLQSISQAESAMTSQSAARQMR